MEISVESVLVHFHHHCTVIEMVHPGKETDGKTKTESGEAEEIDGT